MSFKLLFTTKAKENLTDLDKDSVKLAKVRRTLGLLERDPRYPGINSHKFKSMIGPNGEEIWESYVENRTPAAWRVFWMYGPETGVITIVAITPDP